MKVLSGSVDPVMRVGRTSKHFEEVVFNTLRKVRGDGSSDRRLRLQPRRILNDVLDVDQVEEREGRVRFDLDKDIDVAVRTIIVARMRAENGELRDALAFNGVRVLPYRSDDLVTCHGMAWSKTKPVYQLFRGLAMPEPRVELADQLFGGLRDHGARREDGFRAGRVERVIVLRRDHAADDDHDVLAAVL